MLTCLLRTCVFPMIMAVIALLWPDDVAVGAAIGAFWMWLVSAYFLKDSFFK